MPGRRGRGHFRKKSSLGQVLKWVSDRPGFLVTSSDECLQVPLLQSPFISITFAAPTGNPEADLCVSLRRANPRGEQRSPGSQSDRVLKPKFLDQMGSVGLRTSMVSHSMEILKKSKTHKH